MIILHEPIKREKIKFSTICSGLYIKCTQNIAQTNVESYNILINAKQSLIQRICQVWIADKFWRKYSHSFSMLFINSFEILKLSIRIMLSWALP